MTSLTNPPSVFNSHRTLCYGKLTVNQFKPDAIKGNVNNRSVNDWLVSDVCQR